MQKRIMAARVARNEKSLLAGPKEDCLSVPAVDGGIILGEQSDHDSFEMASKISGEVAP